MVDIKPYQYQKVTNIKEHNDIVAKINEIVDVINNTNLDTVLPRISKLETDVSTIEATDSLQWTDIENLKTKNTEYDTHFGLNDTQIADINKSLISDVALMNGTTTGNVKIRVGRVDAPSIDSNDYNLQKPTSVELVQGSAPAMVKAQITLSDGTVLISDDFMFTTEAIGQDVYISSFVFKNGNVAGTISADIGLSNGSTLTANNFAVPTDPSVTSAISDLQTRMTAVEGGSVGGLDELKATVDGHTASINALDTDVANLQITKADESKVETLTNTVNGKVNVGQGIENAGKVLGIDNAGNVTPIENNSNVRPISIIKDISCIVGSSGSTLEVYSNYQQYLRCNSHTDSDNHTVYGDGCNLTFEGATSTTNYNTVYRTFTIEDMELLLSDLKLTDGSYMVEYNFLFGHDIITYVSVVYNNRITITNGRITYLESSDRKVYVPSGTPSDNKYWGKISLIRYNKLAIILGQA